MKELFSFLTLSGLISSLLFGCATSSPKLGEPVKASLSHDSNQQVVEINIHHGYEPNNIVATTGIPLTLVFGKSDGSCAREVEIPEFGIKETLSPDKNTSVTIASAEDKTIPFHCSMKMMHGQIKFESVLKTP